MIIIFCGFNIALSKRIFLVKLFKISIFAKNFIIMEIVIIGLLAVIVIALIILIFKKNQSGTAISSLDFETVITENNALKINLAKTEERVANLTTEKEHITALLKEEQKLFDR